MKKTFLICFMTFVVFQCNLFETAQAQMKYNYKGMYEALSSYSLKIMYFYEPSEFETYYHPQLGIPESMLDEETLKKWRVFLNNYRQYQYWIWRCNFMRDQAQHTSIMLEGLEDIATEYGREGFTQASMDATNDAALDLEARLQKKAYSFRNKNNAISKQLKSAVETIKKENNQELLEKAEEKEINTHVPWLDWEGKFIATGKFSGFYNEGMYLETPAGRTIKVKKTLWIEDQKYLYRLLQQMKKPIPPGLERGVNFARNFREQKEANDIK